MIYIDPNASGLASQTLTALITLVAAGGTLLRKRVGSAFSQLAQRLRRQGHDSGA
jgi:hypothetical protein